MTQEAGAWRRLGTRVAGELRHLFAITPSDRPWHMPVAAALATGLPLLIGASLHHLAFGLVSSLGGLVFLYMPATPMAHRMAMLMACAFALTGCYTLGMMSQFIPILMVPAVTLIAIAVTMGCRLYGVGPPGNLFFVMAAAIGAYTPVEVLDVPLRAGLIGMGALLACLIAFAYSLWVLRRAAPQPVPPPRPATFDHVVVESVLIGGSVGVALAVAQGLSLEKAYWVPVSCLAVIQGASLRAVWTKHVHRAFGTGAGLLLAWGLLSLPLGPWTIAATMMGLAIIVESLVVRHYAVAVVFITPLAILLAEAASLEHGGAPGPLMAARFVDSVLGGLVGLIGGGAVHSPAVRGSIGRHLRRLVPARLGGPAQGG